MKICKLKLKNLNSFREQVEIDFEQSPLDDASLVAITGPTGSGKTTLLDAICVALYGKTPRLSGTTNQHPRHLISHGETEGFAEVYFQANNTRYHATWSIKRKGSPKAQLLDDSGELITTRVAQEVESILGLDFDAFRRSVMLAQGEFAAFLKASNEERRTILEATAGIHIYDSLRQALNDKVREVEKDYDEVNERLNRIPPASREQLKDAKTERDRLQADAEALGAKIEEIQGKKEQETQRTEAFEKLQSSEERQKELLDKQPEIDVLQAERENAERADRLRSEKQAFDTATSELESADEAFRVAKDEKTEVEKQVEADQTDFDVKETIYQSASAERDRKVEAYAAAKLNVQRAEERFAEAKKRDPDLADLGKQIDLSEKELTEKQTEHTELQEQIDEAQTFLDANHLPTNSPQRLNDATGLLAELTAYQKQLETASASKSQHEKRASSLKREIEKLSKTREEQLAVKTDAEAALENAKNDLNELIATGTREKWAARTQQAAKAQPIAEKYETAKNDLADSENQLSGLMKTATELDTKLVQIEEKLAEQGKMCQNAAETIQHCEDALKFAMLANPINQLRQHLHAGEPCRVCGATEHPYADVVETEGEDLLQNTQTDLENAKADAQTAQERLQALKTKRTQTEQDKHNITKQIEDRDAEIETLRNGMAQFLAEWRDIYPDADVSSKWASEQFIEADTAITAIGDAEKAHTQTSHVHQIATQHLENCENNIANEKKSLSETEKQLQEISNDVEDLEADIKSTKTRFWELLPDTFHGITPKEAVNEFDDKIKEVDRCKDERSRADTHLQVLNTEIKADQDSLENLKERNEALQTEIDVYRSKGKSFLNAVREKTGGLETEAEIDEVIDKLEAESKAKETERDQAEQRLQDSRSLFTQKETAHEICKKQCKAFGEKFDNAYKTYSDKLRDAGFDSLEAHNNAFRDETQVKELTDQIKAHKDEMDQLKSDIKVLQARFEENPFDPEELERIETQLEEIEVQFQEAQQEVGAQQQRVNDLQDALQKRENLAAEVQNAQQELERWKNLHEVIPRNDLRDFALEIVFKQMGNLANEQLRYLTSDRYELKVESIGDLAVVDRWNANEERPVQTLSGGESFLTSLALALALSELSRGRAQLNSLFLDEGFGTLDAETLDTAIAALEGLRMQGRNIFLISHVQELTRRLPVKINVRKRGNGSSYIPSLT